MTRYPSPHIQSRDISLAKTDTKIPYTSCRTLYKHSPSPAAFTKPEDCAPAPVASSLSSDERTPGWYEAAYPGRAHYHAGRDIFTGRVHSSGSVFSDRQFIIRIKPVLQQLVPALHCCVSVGGEKVQFAVAVIN